MTTNHNTPTPTPPAPRVKKKRRHAFLIFFLLVQVVFLIWVLVGIRSGAGHPEDCGTLSRQDCNDFDNAGTAIGVGILVALWAATDIIIGITYGIYRLARR